MLCGRGLEGVVRSIAKAHRIGPPSIERARFFDILKDLENRRFAGNQSLLIDERTKHLLHYSRTVRNQSAHVGPAQLHSSFYEQAILMAQKANELWKICNAPGVQIV
jgi:hypothetical protein